MPYLTASVGRGGSNRAHDVAVVQTALLHLDLREGSRRLVFWSKPIDGRCSRDLERAIAAFQTHQGQRETAKLEPGSKSLAALRDAQRPRLRPLRGLEGTAVAFLGAGTDDDGDYLAGRVAEGMVIPSGLRHALAKLTVELQRRTRLLVVVELCDADAKGRFLARLMFEEGITWIDPASGRLLPSDQAPPEAVRLVTDCAHAISGLVVTNRAAMTLRTPVALKCLAGPRRPFDPARAESLGIDPSSDDFAKQVVEAGIQVAQNIASDAPDPTPPTGEEADAELEDLCEALKRENPRQAERLDEIARGRADAVLDEGQGKHTAKINALIKAGKVGWAKDPRGEIGKIDHTVLVQRGNGVIIVDENGKPFVGPQVQPNASIAFPMSEFIDHLESDDVEGFVSHMYKDSKGKVTIGIGTNLTDNGGVRGAVKLLLGKTLRKTTKNPATPKEIERDYNIITASNLVNTAGKPAAAKVYAPFTTIILSRAGAREIVEDFIRQELTRVENSGDYPDLDKRSKTAQIALLDIVYTMGASGFLKKFKIFKIAYNRRDWVTAADKSSRKGNDGRDAIVRKFLLAQADSEPFYIDAKGKTIGIDRLD